MKVFVSIGIFAVLVAMSASFSNTNSNSGARVCVIDLRNCRTSTTVCGRFGSSNLCKRFSNLCALQSANCAQSASYTQVNATYCSGISVNNRGTCNGLSSSSSSGALSNLFNLGSSSSSNVQPIVIRV